MTPGPVALLEAQRVKRVITGVRETMGPALFDDRVVDAGGELGRDVQLPA